MQRPSLIISLPAGCCLLLTLFAYAAPPVKDVNAAKSAQNAKADPKTEKGKEENLYELLKKREEDLNKREAELNEREVRLNQLKQDVEAKIGSLGKVRSEIEGSFKKIDAAQTEKIAHLVKIYELMPPNDAASRLEKLDDETALLILSKMKQRAAAKIMAFVDPARAAKFTSSLVKPFKMPK